MFNFLKRLFGKKLSPLEEFTNLKAEYGDRTGVNSDYLRKVIEFRKEDECPECDPWFEEKTEAIFAELSQNLDDTIAYLDTCSQQELDYVCQVFEELFEHFQSRKFVECVERNMLRAIDVTTREYIESDLKEMKKLMSEENK